MNRIKSLVWVGALLIACLVYSQTRVVTDERAALDELMASVLSPDSPPPLNLPLVPANAVLESATFWSAFHLSSDGTVTVTKFGNTVTRQANETCGTIQTNLP